jgi:hypothetical protein
LRGGKLADWKDGWVQPSFEDFFNSKKREAKNSPELLSKFLTDNIQLYKTNGYITKSVNGRGPTSSEDFSTPERIPEKSPELLSKYLTDNKQNYRRRIAI